MTKTRKYILLTFMVNFIFLLNTGCEKNKEEDGMETNGNSPWAGTYAGLSYHWKSYPDNNMTIIQHNTTEKVMVNVSVSSNDTTLNLEIIYENSGVINHNKLVFSSDGLYNITSGSGSSYSLLSISFHQDSLNYHSFSKCGIMCDSRVDFDLKKIE